MEESIKYFVPDISDIRVGYECEFYDSDDNDWTKVIIDNQSKLANFTGLEIPLRTPYLTKEQIEAEGWEYVESTRTWPPNRHAFKKGNYFLIFRFDIEVPLLDCILQDPSKEERVSNPERFRFFCDCKDINTFRMICKLLNIN